MSIYEALVKEWDYLAPHDNKAITISNTAKSQFDFKVLPRRYGNKTAVACFLVNDDNFLKETVNFFDGKVETIYVDVEQKQDIDLYNVSKALIHQSKLISVKPNDIAIESCDLLLRKMFDDNLSDKNIAVIGTGNLASKIALRIAERQANVYMEGRSRDKEQKITTGINYFLPAYTNPIRTMKDWQGTSHFDAVISFLSGPYWGEEQILPSIDQKTLIIDGGISNFSSKFIQKMLHQGNTISRLDVRFALPYQFLDGMPDTMVFYDDIYGVRHIGDYTIVAGGYIGSEGSIIVDQIKHPTQIIGVADGMGGVKDTENIKENDYEALTTVRESIQATSC